LELFSLEGKVALLPGGLFVCAEDHQRSRMRDALASRICSAGGANIHPLFEINVSGEENVIEKSHSYDPDRLLVRPESERTVGHEWFRDNFFAADSFTLPSSSLL
jgi:hypothetical protein